MHVQLGPIRFKMAILTSPTTNDYLTKLSCFVDINVDGYILLLQCGQRSVARQHRRMIR